MNNFTNEVLEITELPRFEEVNLIKLHPSYWWVLLISLAAAALFLGIGLTVGIIFIDEWKDYQSEIVSFAIVTAVLAGIYTRLSFLSKGYAFREHDVIYRSGVIAISTIIIPYNRIQHVALHEGYVARQFGLSEIQIYTAGESSSDLQIPGIKKESAENIKQLLVSKIQKHL